MHIRLHITQIFGQSVGEWYYVDTLNQPFTNTYATTYAGCVKSQVMDSPSGLLTSWSYLQSKRVLLMGTSQGSFYNLIYADLHIRVSL